MLPWAQVAKMEDLYQAFPRYKEKPLHAQERRPVLRLGSRKGLQRHQEGPRCGRILLPLFTLSGGALHAKKWCVVCMRSASFVEETCRLTSSRFWGCHVQSREQGLLKTCQGRSPGRRCPRDARDISRWQPYERTLRKFASRLEVKYRSSQFRADGTRAQWLGARGLDPGSLEEGIKDKACREVYQGRHEQMLQG